jgi:hypothetical protein
MQNWFYITTIINTECIHVYGKLREQGLTLILNQYRFV